MQGLMDIGGTFFGGLCAAAAYTGFALMLAARANRSLVNMLLALASAVTAIWAAVLAAGSDAAAAAGILRDAGWFAVVIAMLRQDAPQAQLWRGLAAAAGALTLISLGFAGFHLRIDTGIGVPLTTAAMQLAMAMFGLALIENLVRNLPPERRWSVKLLAIGLATLMAYALVLNIPTFLYGQADSAFVLAEPIIYLLVLPLILVTAVRYEATQLRLHSSRQVVFHSATVIFAGVLLQGTAAAALYVRDFGGTPAAVLAIALGFAGVLAAGAALASHAVRSQIRLFINENFFNYKYDYRVEWTKFIATMTHYGERGTPERVLRTLCDLLDSPAGVLWVRRGGWHQFVPLAQWAFKDHIGPIEANDPLLAALMSEEVAFLELDTRSDAALAWRERFSHAWLMVPLRMSGTLIAVALMNPPRAARSLDWEDRNLVALIATQLAAHLVHEHTAQALADSEQLAEFNNRVAFALHDLKNTAGQLSLLLRNAERHGANPDFQADMVDTIRHAVGNLNRLIARLREPDSSAAPLEQSGETDLVPLLTDFVRGPFARPVRLRSEAPVLPAKLTKADALMSALRHVVTNAVEASPEDGVVDMIASHGNGRIAIRVSDQGEGMTAEFIASELFRPLRSTKAQGLGIGSYQARAILRSLGGDIAVESTPGHGTDVTLYVPAAESVAAENRA